MRREKVLDFKIKLRRVSKLARAALVIALLGSGAAWAQVANPGFETGSLPPWAATFAGGDHAADVRTNASGITPHAGSYFARTYDNDGGGRLSQNVGTVAGQSYTVSVWVAQLSPDPANRASIRLGASNAPVACTLGAAAVWTQCTGSFTAAGSSERLDLLFETAPGTGIIAFDEVDVPGVSAVQAVPTLSEWALLALALAAGGLGLRRLRRKA